MAKIAIGRENGINEGENKIVETNEQLDKEIGWEEDEMI